MKVLKKLAIAILELFLSSALLICGMVFMLNSTILNPDFVVREVERLDISSLASEFAGNLSPQMELPGEYQPYADEVVENTFVDLEPWVEEQAPTVVHAVYDYFLGRSQSISLEISLEPVGEAVKENLRDAVISSPPPELQGQPPAVIEQALVEINQQIDEQFSEAVRFSQSDLDPDAREILEQVRQYIGYFQIVYWALPVLILLLVLGIAFLYGEVRSATRNLGISFLIVGALIFIGTLVGRYFMANGIGASIPPAPLWIQQPVTALYQPLDIYAIVLAAIGVAMLVVSFLYKPRPSES